MPFYPEGSELRKDSNLDLWMLNTIMWVLERSNNIIVFDDLALPAANIQESGCTGMIGAFYMCLQYDETLSEKCLYYVMTRIPGVYRNSEKNYDTFAKDW